MQKSSFDLELNPFEQSFAPKKAAGHKDTIQKPVANDEALNKANPPLIPLSSNNLTPGGSRRLPPPANQLTPGLSQLTPGVLHGYLNKALFSPNESNVRTGLTPGGYFSGISGLTPNTNLFTPGFSSIIGLEKSNTAETSEQSVRPKPVAPVEKPGSVSDDQSEGTNGTNDSNDTSTHNNKEKDSESAEENDETLVKEEDGLLKRLKKNDGKPKKKTRTQLSEDDKRKNFLERNRLAASKCRQRKKQVAEKMKDDLQFYTTGYTNLKRDVTTLRSQMTGIRSLLILHRRNLTSAVGIDVVDHLLLLAGDTNVTKQEPLNNIEVGEVPTQAINGSLNSGDLGNGNIASSNLNNGPVLNSGINSNGPVLSSVIPNNGPVMANSTAISNANPMEEQVMNGMIPDRSAMIQPHMNGMLRY